MIKPGSLRHALGEAIPALRGDPDRLLVFIDRGRIVSTGGRSLSFEYRYVLNAVLLDFTGDTDEVFVAILAWVRRHQPDLLGGEQARDEGIAFEADHLTAGTCDLSVKLELSESVVVETDEDGAQATRHVDEGDLAAWDGSGKVVCDG